MRPLTTFEGIQSQIIDVLKDKETLGDKTVDNLVIRMTGWQKNGVFANVPTGVRAEKVLGGNAGFKDLISYCKANDVELFPEFDFSYSWIVSMFDDFKPKKDLARTIDDRLAYRKQYWASHQNYYTTGPGVISPHKMQKFYEQTYAQYKNYGIGNISVGSLGDSLNSDFNEKNPANREDSKVLLNRMLSKVDEQNDKVMLSGGNIFTVKYADFLVNVPLEDSKMKCATASIPFLSMVLHGCVEYSGSALNLAGDYQSFILRTIENGANPYFIVALQNAAELKMMFGNYTKYYSVRYSIWLRDIYDTYQLINEALSDVRYSQIISHEFIDRDSRVARVEYENGVTFIINYLTEDFTYYDNGEVRTVPAENFLKLDAAGNMLIGE